MMKRSLIAFVTIAALVALVSCRGTTAVPKEPASEPPPVVAAPTLTGGAWVAKEPWMEDVDGDPVEHGTIHYKLTFTTSRFIHVVNRVQSGTSDRYKLLPDSGTWRADDTTITKVAWNSFALEPSAVEHVKSYRFEDDGDTLVMTHWAEDRPTVTMRELRYTREPETSIIGSWSVSAEFRDLGTSSEVSLQIREDGTFSVRQTVTRDEGDAEVTSAWGRYTDDPEENFLILSDVTLTQV